MNMPKGAAVLSGSFRGTNNREMVPIISTVTPLIKKKVLDPGNADLWSQSPSG